VLRLDASDGLGTDLRTRVGVTVTGSDQWPPAYGGKMRVRTREGGEAWAPDTRTGRRWLSWVLAEREP
jgi:hypothetical protein